MLTNTYLLFLRHATEDSTAQPRFVPADPILGRILDWQGEERLSYAARLFEGAALPPFRVPNVGRDQWIIGQVTDRPQVPQYLVNSLCDKPRDKVLCSICGLKHFARGCDLIKDEPQIQWGAAGLFNCSYPYCAPPLGTPQPHSTSHCEVLNQRCLECGFRGHSRVNNVCLLLEDNYKLFQEYVPVGWITKNAHRPEGASCGFFPVYSGMER